MTPASTVTSHDGTAIAYYRTGSGPALILVDGAMCHSSFGPSPALAAALSSQFTVYTYDRRGRARSGDTPPYGVAREVEDIEALVSAAGGSAYVYGISSGAALALEAAASGLPITKLALFEPPYTAEFGDPAEVEREHARINDLLDRGNRGEAAESFLLYVMPQETVDAMKSSPAWPQIEAVAPTLAYDNAVMGDGTIPRDRTAIINVPTLVLAGDDSPDVLRGAAKAVADAVPGARYESLEGLDHTGSPEPHAPMLRDFFTGS